MTHEELDRYANGFYWTKIKNVGWMPIKLSRIGKDKNNFIFLFEGCGEFSVTLEEIEKLGLFLISPDAYLEGNLSESN